MLNISFIIPTYNAGLHIGASLKSIRSQKYPQDKIEILILDGGSVDETLNIVSSYNCRFLKNSKKLAEYGVQLGMQNARGDLLAVFAADNELVNNNWVQKVVDVFNSDKDISAVWGRLAAGEKDSSLNKYFELIQSDPLNWFLNKNLNLYKKNAECFNKDFYKFKVDPRRPLVWGANGLVYRAERIKEIWAQEGYLGDNDAFQYMIEQGENKVGYFDLPFAYHHHVSRLRDWIKKWKRNFIHHLADKQETRNMNWVFTGNCKMKLFFWGVYNIIPIFSISHSIYLTLKDRNIHWLYHPLVSFMQFFTYTALVIFTRKGRKFIKSNIFGNFKVV